MADQLLHVTNDTFESEVLKAEKPVVVDFWAAWCRPCLKMAPIFEDLALEYGSSMTFAKLDTDENQETAFKLGIQGIPTLIFFRNGQEVNRVIGFESRENLKRHIDSVLAAVA